MNKKLPFEDALNNKLQQLPKPGEESSWQAMSKLLDDNKKRLVPPPLKKYLLFTFLGLILSAGLVLLFRNNDHAGQVKAGNDYKKISPNAATSSANNKFKLLAQEESDKATEPANKTLETPVLPNDKKRTDKLTVAMNLKTKPLDEPQENKAILQKNKSASFTNTRTLNGKQKFSFTKALTSEEETATNNKELNELLQAGILPKQSTRRHTKAYTKIKTGAGAETTGSQEGDMTEEQPTKVASYPISERMKNMASNTSIAEQPDKSILEGIPVTDSINRVINSQPVAADNTIKKVNKKLSPFLWSAGLGLQQSIPLGKQQLAPYGFNGNGSLIRDYVPSVYLRLEKKKKWFLQAEFSYGSPWLVSEFPYSRQTTLNNTSTKTSTTTLLLKKTYYHKIPVHFNYYLKPNWSVGTGVMYSLLHRAISSQAVTTKNLQTQQEETSSQIIAAGFNDSFFYKSQLSWLLQTNYDWKRFSFGIRYSNNLQPFIQYTTPEGVINKRKNWSLEFLLRFRIWQCRTQ